MSGRKIQGKIGMAICLAAILLLCTTTVCFAAMETGKAKGTLVDDDVEVSLQWAYAIKAPDMFDESKKVTVLTLTETPIQDNPFPNRVQLMFMGVQGKMKGLMAVIDETGNLTSMDLFNGKTMTQLSGTLAYAFKDLGMDEKQVRGKLTSVPGDAKSELNVSFMALFQELDRCTEPFSVNEETWEKLPPGGGEPGQAFMIFDKGYNEGDVEIAKAGLCNVLAKDITADDFKEPSMRTRNIKITGGFIKEDKAQLLGEGLSPITETEAKVFVWMAKTADGWKVARQREQ